MSSSAFDVVRITTGMRLRSGSALIFSRTSRPSITGRLRSRRIKSGRAVPAYFPWLRRQFSASCPLLARIRFLGTFLVFKTSWGRRTSPALSSTSRISTGIGWDSKFILFSPLYFVVFCSRDREAKRGSASRRRLDPNAPAVPFDDFLANGQTDTRAGILGLGMKPLKDHEDAVGVLLRDADAVIANRDLPVVPVPLG